jgi:hypothetical protein
MMQLAKKVPFDNPDVLFLVRCIYLASNVIILGLYMYTQSKINQKKGMHLSAIAPGSHGRG